MARHKAFNPDVALDKAMHMFWLRGYEATSMEDLLQAMDINRGSLYNTFGDKRQLFLKVLERYCCDIIGSRVALLEQPGPALPALRAFIVGMANMALADPERRGCLIANTVMELAPHEREIQQKLAHTLKVTEDTFLRVLRRAKKQQELANGSDPRALARFLTALMQGAIVMIKSGASAETIRQTVQTGLRILDA